MLKSDPSTWRDPRHRAGAEAELRAARLLRGAGFEILEQRYRWRRHDVDLVARRGSLVAFVEVKSRRDGRFGRALEAVTARKQSDVVRSAAAWMQFNARPGDVARFDVITVDGPRLEWVQGAFRPLWR